MSYNSSLSAALRSQLAAAQQQQQNNTGASLGQPPPPNNNNARTAILLAAQAEQEAAQQQHRSAQQLELDQLLLQAHGQRESELRDLQLRAALGGRSAAAPASALELALLQQQAQQELQLALLQQQAQLPLAAARMREREEQEQLYNAILLRERAAAAAAASAPSSLDELRFLAQHGLLNTSEREAPMPTSVLEQLIAQRDAAVANAQSANNVSASELMELERARLMEFERARLIREMMATSSANSASAAAAAASPPLSSVQAMASSAVPQSNTSFGESLLPTEMPSKPKSPPAIAAPPAAAAAAAAAAVTGYDYQYPMNEDLSEQDLLERKARAAPAVLGPLLKHSPTKSGSNGLASLDLIAAAAAARRPEKEKDHGQKSALALFADVASAASKSEEEDDHGTSRFPSVASKKNTSATELDSKKRASTTSATLPPKKKKKKAPATAKASKKTRACWGGEADGSPVVVPKKDKKWMNWLSKLKDFRGVYGHCQVPRSWSKDSRLATWVKEQRKEYKRYSEGKPSSITPERIAMLEEIGFCWDAQEGPRPEPVEPADKKKHKSWMAMLEKLKVFRKETGHCVVPRGYIPDPKLGNWVATQRKEYKLLQDGKTSNMTPDRIALLEELDFAWNAQEAAWSGHMSDLRKFRATHGHCRVPPNHAEYPKLGAWVSRQHWHYTLFKQGKTSLMTQDRVDELTQLDFFKDHADDEGADEDSSLESTETESS